MNKRILLLRTIALGFAFFGVTFSSLSAQNLVFDVFTTIIHDTQVHTEFGPYNHATATNNGIGLGIGYQHKTLGTMKLSWSYVNKNIGTTENAQVTGGLGRAKTIAGSSQFMYRLKYEPNMIFGSGPIKLQPTASFDLIQNRHLQSGGSSTSGLFYADNPEPIYTLESVETETHRMLTHPFITLGTDIRIRKSLYLGFGYRIPIVGDYLTRDFTYRLNGQPPAQQRITVPGFAFMFNIGISFSAGK